MCLHLSVPCGCPMSFGRFGNFDSVCWILSNSFAAYSTKLVRFSPVCLLVWGICVGFSWGYCPIAPCFKHVCAGGGGVV